VSAELEHVVPALLTIKRVATVLDCSTRTVRRRIHDGSLPAVIEGERTMVRGDDLQRYIDALGSAGATRQRRPQPRRHGYDFLA
jgi:excisionase family DNA binding protein